MKTIKQSLSKAEIEKIKKHAEREKSQRLKTAAFLDWQQKLHRKDQLPRGRFFKGKKAGKPVVIIDECHRYFSSPMSDLINLSKFK